MTTNSAATTRAMPEAICCLLKRLMNLCSGSAASVYAASSVGIVPARRADVQNQGLRAWRMGAVILRFSRSGLTQSGSAGQRLAVQGRTPSAKASRWVWLGVSLLEITNMPVDYAAQRDDFLLTGKRGLGDDLLCGTAVVESKLFRRLDHPVIQLPVHLAVVYRTLERSGGA